MLFQDAIADARSELGDTYAGSYSYAAADMLRYAVDGVREAWRVRPSLRYDPTTLLPYEAADVLPPSVNEDSYEIPIPEAAQVAITYYIIFRCLSRDVTDAGNAAAAKMWKSEFDRIVAG